MGRGRPVVRQGTLHVVNRAVRIWSRGIILIVEDQKRKLQEVNVSHTLRTHVLPCATASAVRRTGKAILGACQLDLVVGNDVLIT
eukprot:3101074-Prymnesium_polylepis.3